MSRPSHPSAPPGRSFLLGGLLVMAVVLAYANSLGNPFVFDDTPGIVENASIRNLADLGTVLSPAGTDGSGVNSRPLVNLSLALNYAIGGLNPTGYHLVNLALHALATLALFGLVRRACLLPRWRERWAGIALPGAFAAALVWALHPLLTETVTLVIQRTEGLMGALFLGALYGLVRSLGAESGPARRGWSVMTVTCCLLGILAKEVTAVLPLVALLLDRTFAAGSFRAAWRERRGVYLALAATWLPLAGLVMAGGGRGGTVLGGSLSVYHYALTQCEAIVRYLGLALWPHPLVMDYGAYLVPGFATVWWQAAVIGLIVGATVWALWRRPVAGFFGACFLLILAPSSSVVPLITQTMAEHRMYLPLATIVVPAMLAFWLRFRRAAWGATAALAIVFLATTAVRNHDYRSALAIWEDTARKWPANTRAHSGLALALFDAGRLPEALAESTRAVALPPESPNAHGIHGNILAALGRFPEAVDQYNAVLRLEPDNAATHYNLGTVLAQTGHLPEAREHFEWTLRRDPRNFGARMNLANVLAESGQLPAAVSEFRQALEIEPDNIDVSLNLGTALVEEGEYREAANLFAAVLRRQPDNRQAAESLRVLQSLGPEPQHSNRL